MGNEQYSFCIIIWIIILHLFKIEKITLNISFLIVIIIVISIVIIFTLLIYLTFVQRIIKEKNIQYEKDIHHQKELLQQNIAIQESEQERIAILLHDDIGNKLNILSVWLNNKDTWNNEKSKNIVLHQIPKLIDVTRNISHSLYPVNFEQFGLILTIEELISNIEGSLSIKLNLLKDYIPNDISLDLQIYRVIQEFLSNVLKHSKATKMQIDIKSKNDSTIIILKDNGIGFDIDSTKRGMGIKNIELRLESITAISKWKSINNKGTRLLIRIPK